MTSPFPGMNPFVESPQFWAGFHNSLANVVMGSLNQRIMPDYYAQTMLAVTYDVIEINTGLLDSSHVLHPDISIWESSLLVETPAQSTLTITPPSAESVIPYEVELHYFSVEIRYVETDELITVIEILTPVSKRTGHEAHEDYLRKRRDLVRAGVNLLEIDLLRAGTRPPLMKPVPRAPYYVTLSRRNRRPRVEVWPIQLADRLPVLPVPLVEPDSDVPLDLGLLVQTIYNNGPYAAAINYHDPLPPPLTDEETQFVQDCLQQANLMKE